MSYQTYITEALIVGSFDNNTADKSYLLFTRDAGMIYAAAKSVREERSRQRFALQDFSLITVSLIKGKTGWRIGSVQSKGNLFIAANDRAVRGSIVRICKHLRRFVAGEDPHIDLYDEVVLGLHYIMNPDLERRVLMEEIILARLLHILGYIADTNEFGHILKTNIMVALEGTYTDAQVSMLKSATAKAVTVSHL